jgi:hypothetical protein
MLPLEIVFFFLIIIWSMIGSVRGFSREVGATIAIVLAMCVLLFFGPQMIMFMNKVLAGLFGKSVPTVQTGPGTHPMCPYATPEQFWFYTLGFTVIVYIGYQGATFGLPTELGTAPRAILGLLIGAINGYFIAGNLWWFLHYCARYNLPNIGITPSNAGLLSSTAQSIVAMLPFNIFSPVLLIGLLFLLLVLRIVK